ncbi:hypothetical protein TNCV_3900291 [Trichonephila clavipes]|nr:hypothetical protein TNCV_3900291 [Trichonephila clavipes]
MHCLPPNDVPVFAEEANHFATNERNNFRMAKKETKQKEKREFPNSVMKDVNPFRQNNNTKKMFFSELYCDLVPVIQ